jgi:nicotinate dehydrogenase subunit A
MPVYELKVNGAAKEVDVPASKLLLDVLRDDFDLTGAKPGCGEGQCGSCTVLVDGKAQRSCLMQVSQVGEKSIETIEGLASEDGLDVLQKAFLEKAAFQCGYCTPGMILAAKALLAGTPRPSRAEVREALNGNICRCGTYGRIVDAVLQAAEGSGRG